MKYHFLPGSIDRLDPSSEEAFAMQRETFNSFPRRIRNMTPHPVHIVDEENKIIRTFEPDGLIRLKTEITSAGSFGGVPLVTIEFGEPEGLPERSFGTLIIVSHLVQSALPDRNDLVVPEELQFDDDGQIIGCRSLRVSRRV
jgi:hypothetical protein